jgi:hypothetical protein
MTPEKCVRSLIDEAAREASAAAVPAADRMNIQEFFRAMATYSEKIPELPDEAYTRESFYQDHD